MMAWGSRVRGDVVMLSDLCSKYISSIMICWAISKMILILLEFIVVWALLDGRLTEPLRHALQGQYWLPNYLISYS